MAARNAPSTAMPTRMRRGLSRKRRRGGGGSVVERGPSARLGVIDVTVAGTALFLRVQEVLELVHELSDVAEVTVHRREPHVRHFVEFLELFHHEAADLGRRDFLFRPLLQ